MRQIFIIIMASLLFLVACSENEIIYNTENFINEFKSQSENIDYTIEKESKSNFLNTK